MKTEVYILLSTTFGIGSKTVFIKAKNDPEETFKEVLKKLPKYILKSWQGME